jgi:prevent-host-death family protein
MREREPMTQTIKASDIRTQWSTVINRVARKEARILVEKSGVPVAAIVSAEDFERLRRLDAEREQAFSVLDRIGMSFADVPVEVAEEQVTKALGEVRAENRRTAAQAK